MFSTFEKIKELCKKKGISLNQLEDKLGFSQNYIYSMKKGNPKVENLQKIADYFGVSTDYLLGRTNNPKIATDETAIVNGQVIDLRKAAANTMLFDGKPLNDDDIDFITAVLTAHFKNKQKD
ncbi:helix-turn-helix domain-containing protein [Streptococcus hyovaginalis]|uniref:helix-turn-helix domain-containing protein n=1 Tax=Streptococcus hyovaginalis TaxID=149015 RepID=UPI0004050FBD|nr:helix-turn-helix transcriptional regulator [Streptococcus hyovaginalis]QBX25463.1 Cro/CI family transcriptional regulator [Streptococcus phage Javan258]